MLQLRPQTTDKTVRYYFDSFDSSGGSVTMTGLAVTDIEIYKDGSTTQRSSDAGITLLDTDGIDFDGATGCHGFSIDLSDDTDSGFYAVGSNYAVMVNAVTIDSQTVRFWACQFDIVPRGRLELVVPAFLERPASSTDGKRLWIYSYGPDGALKDLDAVPTVAAENESATDRSSKLGTVTKQGASTGIYFVVYTVDSADAIEAIYIKADDDDGIEYAAATHIMDSNSPSLTEINAEVDQALADIHLDHLFAADYDPASKPGTATALLNELVESDAGVSRFTTNALENAPGGGGGSDWSSDEKDEIRYRLGIDGTTSAPASNAPNLGTVDANVTQISGDSGAADNLEADYDGTGYNKSASTIGTATNLGADAVDATSLADGAITAGKIGASAITSGKIAADAIGASELAADAVSEIQSGLATSAALTTVDGVVDAIKAVTDALPDAGALTTIDGNVDAIKVITDALTAAGATKLAASMLGLVSTAVNDASATTTSFVTDLTEATDDHYNGGVIVFTSGALAGQRTDITDYNGTTKAVTVTALTEAPGDNDTFVIV